MASISTMLPDQCAVLRDCTLQHIDGRNVVPGDLLKLTMGNKLPADVRFVDASSDCRLDRSILTGETSPLLASVDSTDKNYLETACIGMAGTHCVSGNAWGLVLETGDRTVFGRIAKLTSTPKGGMTPLQKEIFYFVCIIVSLMVVMVILVVIVWATWLRKSHPDWITVPTLIVDCSPPSFPTSSRIFANYDSRRLCCCGLYPRRTSDRHYSFPHDHSECSTAQQSPLQESEDRGNSGSCQCHLLRQNGNAHPELDGSF